MEASERCIQTVIAETRPTGIYERNANLHATANALKINSARQADVRRPSRGLNWMHIHQTATLWRAEFSSNSDSLLYMKRFTARNGIFRT